MSGEKVKLKLRGKVRVEDVTANKCTKARSTEMLFNFVAYSIQLPCPFSCTYVLAFGLEGLMCVCVHKISTPEFESVSLCRGVCVRLCVPDG